MTREAMGRIEERVLLRRRCGRAVKGKEQWGRIVCVLETWRNMSTETQGCAAVVSRRGGVQCDPW